ncbi:MAG: rod shape-determining protein MreC [Anaerolineae bacterium]|nr:MAG: rod shape-determining protein MreC [Anaerolineae bacterium]
MRSSNRRKWQPLIIALGVLGVLALAFGGYLNPVSGALLRPLLPIQAWLNTRFLAFQTFLEAPADTARLQQENELLEQEVARLQAQVIALQQQVTEVEILSALLDFARAQPSNQYQAAAVIGRDPSPFLQYILINRGSDDGLRRGMPVVSAEGLVGRVTAVTANAARVQLITDPAALVDVRILPAEADGVMTGSLTADLFIDQIPVTASLQSGDLVLTSGLGGGYPANILVGQVTSVRNEATALFQQASLDAVTDFARLEIVLVIINFRPIDVTPLLPTPAVP